MDFKDLQQRAKDLQQLFRQLETKENRGPWGKDELMLGLVGDIGDLAKLVQAAGGARKISDLQSKIEHELADCLWSILVLAQELNVDLEEAYCRTIDELKLAISSKIEA